MAQRWACEPGGDLAGIVSISGAAPGADDAPCAATRPVRALLVHGDQDDTVRYQGGTMNGATHPSARTSVKAWLRPNGCEPDAAPKSEVSRRLFDLPLHIDTWSCPHAKVALWTVPGGGHKLRLGRGFVSRALDFLDGR